MFTGIIQALGKVEAIEQRGGDVRVTVDLGELANDKHGIGDSIAVNGCCLTAIEDPRQKLVADVSKESLRLTTIGDLKVGDRVNLEPAMQVGDRFGGHMVSGHVDGMGRLVELAEEARSWRLVFEAPDDIAHYIAKKGSITIDGISLTVNGVDGNRFDVNIVPHTWEHTNLHAKQPGDRVNLEVDVIARYLERLLQAGDEAPAGITLDTLRRHGFADE
ncbi:MAG: riboflavin synthase [Gammaproteobacteria bacterium]|nr:riboflavin synthase [Gammaproteobacteria bacterium]